MSTVRLRRVAPREKLFGHYSYVLFCREGELVYVKIGVAANPLARLKNITTGLPFLPQLFLYCHHQGREGALDLEANMLGAFRQWRVRGEWLKMTPQEAEAMRRSLTRADTSAIRKTPLVWQSINVQEYVRPNVFKKRANQRIRMPERIRQIQRIESIQSPP
jgi:hypothetical protein